MKLLLAISFFIVLAAFHQNGYAQKSEIKGKITDSITMQPLGFITLQLRNTNNILISSMQSKDDGSFHFHGLNQESCLLKISSIGFQSKTVFIHETKAIRDLGQILLSPESSSLKEVLIKGEKPLIRQEIDRISYNLEADPESRSSSLIDMIKKVPLLSLDADENMLLYDQHNADRQTRTASGNDKRKQSPRE